MKKVVLLFLISFSFAFNYAQEISYGLKAGLNVAKLNFSDADANEVYDSRMALHFGAVVEFSFSDKFSVEPEILYSSVGTKADMGGMEAKLADDEIMIVADYLTIPVMAKYYVAEGFSINAGPQIGFLLSAKIKTNDETVDMKDEFESTDFGLGLGAGYKMENGLFFDARYVLGLSNIAKEMPSDEYVKNNVLQFSVGYKFK